MYHRVLKTLNKFQWSKVNWSLEVTTRSKAPKQQPQSHLQKTTKWMNICTKSVINTIEQRPLSSLDKVFMTFWDIAMITFLLCLLLLWTGMLVGDFSILLLLSVDSEQVFTYWILTSNCMVKFHFSWSQTNASRSGINLRKCVYPKI